MIIDFANYNANQRYHAMTQTVIPRPIAWVLTQHKTGHYNLAPFSYFSAVSSDPALLMFSVGDKQANEPKDTKQNALDHPYFVVHIPTQAHAQQVTDSARTLPAEHSELDGSGLELCPFEGFEMPRLAGVPIAFGCKLHSVQAIQGAPQSLVFGEIQKIYLDDRVASIETVERQGKVSERLAVNASQVDPLARLGASFYAGIGNPFQLRRPD